MPLIETCYQKVSGEKADLKGKATLRLTVDRDGKVSKVTLVSTQLRDKRFEQCLLKKIKELRFPPPEGKKEVTVTVSLSFT